MANNVIFIDNRIKVEKAIDDRINAVLEECAGELESATKRLSRVDTGKTKNSFRHRVDPVAHEAFVGSNDENAIWEEFGTGEYALKGNGRKGGWVYRDAKGEWHHTYGKKPWRAFWRAYMGVKDKIIKRLENALKGL